MQDTFVTASGRQPSLIFQNNAFNDLNGGIGLFSTAGSPFDFYNYIVVDNNTQGNASSGSYKGLVYVDGSGTLRPLGSRTKLYYTTNYHLTSSTRTDYSSSLDQFGVAYKFANFSNNPIMVAHPLFASSSWSQVSVSSSFAVSASWAQNFLTSSVTSASFAQTASFVNTALTASYVMLSELASGTGYANDTDAAAAGVPVGGIYRNGNFIQIRLS
jgi:hypothetical protein